MLPNKVSFQENENENYKEPEEISEGVHFDISNEMKKEVEEEIRSHDNKQIKLTVTEKIN